MGKIAEMLAVLKDTENPVEDLDALIAAADKAHEDELSVRDAKVSKTLEDLEKSKVELSELKVHNYDLIKRIPVESADDTADNKPETKVSGTESFFED